MARFNIVDGPGKWDLMVALFDGNARNRRGFEFMLGETPHVCVIEELGREDGTGDKWHFKGFYAGVSHPLVNGVYSTRTRKGWIEIAD